MSVELYNEQASFLNKLEKEGKSFNTLKNYKTDLQCFLEYVQKELKDSKINEFSFDQVFHYTTYINNRYPSINSRRRRIQALRLFFDFLVNKGMYDSNPIRKINVSPKFVDIPRPPQMKDILQFFNYIQTKLNNSQNLEQLVCLRNKILFYLIYDAGLKVSDIEGLKQDNFLFDAENNCYRILIKHPKRDAISVPLSLSFNPLYTNYIELLNNYEQSNNLSFKFILFNANPYKILSGDLSARGCEIIFKEISEILSIKITPKTLRQACIFRWIREKINDSTIKEWMGVLPNYSLKKYFELYQNGNNPDYLFFKMEDFDR